MEANCTPTSLSCFNRHRRIDVVSSTLAAPKLSRTEHHEAGLGNSGSSRANSPSRDRVSSKVRARGWQSFVSRLLRHHQKRHSSKKGGQRHSVVITDMVRSSLILATTASPDCSRIMIPLNESELLALSQSWKIVHKDLIDTGLDMFITMFERDPTVKVSFEKFRDLNNESTAVEQSGTYHEMAHNAVLRTHGMVVMNAIDEIISCLGDSDEVTELLIEQGRAHARFGDNLSKHIFWAIEEPFLLAVRRVLKDKYTATLDRVYRKTIRYILTVLSAGFLQAAEGPARLTASSAVARTRSPRLSKAVTFASTERNISRELTKLSVATTER